MTKVRYFIGNVFFLILLFGVEMQAQEVDVYLVNQEAIIAKPGKVTTVVINISNESTANLKVQPKFFYPKKWSSITDTAVFEIKSKSKSTKLLSFFVPNQTPTENYELAFELEEVRTKKRLQSLSFSVQVKEIVNISIKGIEAPDFVIAGENIHAKFIVRNFGNSEQTILLTPYSCDLIGPERIVLPPNTIQIIEVAASTISELRKVSRKSFRLEGRTSTDNPTQAHAYLHSRVIPNANEEINDGKQLPSYVRLSYIGHNRNNVGYSSGWQGELYTQGSLDEAGKNNLELKLQGPNQFNISSLGLYDEYYAKFETPNYKLHIGDKTYSLSPLTEYARNGRGIEASIQQNHFEAGGFFHRPRFFPTITNEIGVYARHHINQKNTISLNYLHKNYENSEVPASLVSLHSRFALLKNTIIETEVSKGDHGRESGYAGYFRVESSSLKKLRLSSTILYASQDFPGYFTNTWYYTGSANFSITRKISAFANVYQDERNAARDTLYATAPFSKQYQGGLNFRFSTKTQIRASVSQNELKDLLPSKKFHRLNQSVKLQINQSIRSLQLSSAIEYGRTQNFLNPEGQEYSRLFRTYLNLNYQLSHRHNFRGFVQFLENNDFNNLNRQQIIYGISGNSKITKSTYLRFQYQNNFEIEEYYRDRNLFELHFTQKIKRQHEISLSGRYALQRQTVNSGDFSVAAHYKYNFGIPLEGKKKQSALLGQIFNTGSDSVEGIVLYLNGKTAITNSEGQFKFRSLAPGKYYLLLDQTTLALHQIPDVPTPIEVEIIEGQDTNLSFGLTTSATISGHLDIIPKKLLTSSGKKNNLELPGPLLIELTDGEDSFRQITEPDGSFIFSGLRPGKWTLNIIYNDLFKHFSLDEETFELELKPGQKEDIQIRLRKKERKIKFLQSLSLTSKD